MSGSNGTIDDAIPDPCFVGNYSKRGKHTVAEAERLLRDPPRAGEDHGDDDGHEPPPARIQWIDAKGVKPLPVDWLVDGRIPRGMLTTIAGVQGDGKSILIADLAARISAGRSFAMTMDKPNPVGRVFIFAAEDSPEHTLVPRLIAHGADLSRVHFAETTIDPCGGERLFSITQDLAELEREVVQRGDVAAVIFDPVNSFIGAGLKPNNDEDVRPVLQRLKKFSAATGVATIAIKHLNKSGMENALHRVSGASAYTEVPRCCWFVARDREDTERRKWICGKMNIARMPPGAAYDIVGGVVQWVAGEINESASDAIGPDVQHEDLTRSKVDEAEDWLRLALAEGAVKANDILAESTKQGIKRRTLHRAKANLKVVSEWTSIPSRQAWWRLPDCQTPLVQLLGNGGDGGNGGNKNHCQGCHVATVAKGDSDWHEGLPV